MDELIHLFSPLFSLDSLSLSLWVSPSYHYSPKLCLRFGRNKAILRHLYFYPCICIHSPNAYLVQYLPKQTPCQLCYIRAVYFQIPWAPYRQREPAGLLVRVGDMVPRVSKNKLRECSIVGMAFAQANIVPSMRLVNGCICKDKNKDALILPYSCRTLDIVQDCNDRMEKPIEIETNCLN